MRDAESPAPQTSPPHCRHEAGVFAPVIDPNRCEGKSACVAECPYDVFVVRRRERAELPQLNALGTLKWWVHGGLQAEAVHAGQCHGCGLCVSSHEMKLPQHGISREMIQSAVRIAAI